MVFAASPNERHTKIHEICKEKINKEAAQRSRVDGKEEDPKSKRIQDGANTIRENRHELERRDSE